jgi:two-component system chemotaxis response regulator CheV
MTSKRSDRSGILLDAGTNELEVLVFQLAGGLFGVNVAKVREVVRRQEPTQSPHLHPAVIGMINLRGSVLPMVDLAGHLGLDNAEVDDADQRVIVTEFNGLRAGFVVDGVDQIHRMSWSRVQPAPDLSAVGGSQARALSSCTGVIELHEKLVLMIDFESVCDAILKEDRLHLEEAIDNPHDADRSSCTVVLAEDSPFMRELMMKTFREAGYTRAAAYANGAEAWSAIEELARAGERLHCVVSDIEMPRMDGLHLTKRVRELEATASVPIVLFSSLISADNRKKGEQVGASTQVAKPEMRELIDLVDRAVTGKLPAIPEPRAAA